MMLLSPQKTRCEGGMNGKCRRSHRYFASKDRGTSIAADFSFTRTVQNGTTLDFAVDPGAAADIDNDATQISVTIERAN